MGDTYLQKGDTILNFLNGLIVPEVRGNETVPEVVTTSGYVLLHFFSDAAYNLTGFNIFYSINSCPNNCSGHGKCTTSVSIPSQVYCECDKYWKGEACDIPYCKANCGSPDHGSNSWLVPETKGAIVQGGYGHSSVYNEMTKSIYVHGGYKALPGNKYGLVDDLYRYEVNTRTWTILKESGFAKYLHSAVLISGALLIFGGNTHNDTSLSNGAKCFSADFLAYDIACDEWKILPKPNLHRDVNRFGHTAVDALFKSFTNEFYLITIFILYGVHVLAQPPFPTPAGP
uniref:Attractin like 1 n=1 Tax=Chelydra serpentina TaxID=8475 RepID=A0A8C3S6J9_CHESE